MSRSRSNAPAPPHTADRAQGPQAAFDALLGSDAGDPIRRALWLDSLDLQLRSNLPPGVAAHARLANLDRGRLVYLVDAPVWHARLRHAATELLAAARSIGLEADELVVKITTRPLFAPVMTTTTKPLALSAAAQDAMQTARMPPDEEPSAVG